MRKNATPIVTYVNKYRFSSNNVLGVDSLKKILGQRPSYAKGPDYNDLWFLWNAVRKKNPKVILEFGSGWSTYVIANALAANAVQGSNGFL